MPGYEQGGSLKPGYGLELDRVREGDSFATYESILNVWKFIHDRVLTALDKLTYNVRLTWTRVPYAAGDFTASAGTWTVDAADVVDLSYVIIGNTMILAFTIIETDVSTGALLRIRVPEGYKIKSTNAQNLCRGRDAGTNVFVLAAAVAANATFVELYNGLAAANFTATTGDNTDVIGQIAFEVERTN